MYELNLCRKCLKEHGETYRKFQRVPSIYCRVIITEENMCSCLCHKMKQDDNVPIQQEN